MNKNVKKKFIKKNTNPLAKILRTSMYKSKIKKSKKIYSRKKILI